MIIISKYIYETEIDDENEPSLKEKIKTKVKKIADQGTEIGSHLGSPLFFLGAATGNKTLQAAGSFLPAINSIKRQIRST